MNTEPIKSPCTLVCTIDHHTGFCLGCARSLDEIGRWSSMKPDEQIALLDVLKERHIKLKQKEI